MSRRKSVLLALMALQFRRYPGSQIFAFDFGGSIRAAALAMNGDWHDLGGSLTDGDTFSVALQPLARIDDPAERAWAADWIAAILKTESSPITPEIKDHLWSALTSLASAPASERTITGLTVLRLCCTNRVMCGLPLSPDRPIPRPLSYPTASVMGVPRVV